MALALNNLKRVDMPLSKETIKNIGWKASPLTNRVVGATHLTIALLSVGYATAEKGYFLILFPLRNFQIWKNKNKKQTNKQTNKQKTKIRQLQILQSDTQQK